MKLVIFAHTPPPHHGQSYMVAVLLDGLRDPAILTEIGERIQCFHVNARVSDELGDIGSVRLGKLFQLFGYCLQAIWFRLRHGASVLYYVPAPAKRSAILRDWIVMLFVRPWFRTTIFHWHAFGLGHWAAGRSEFPSGPDGREFPPPSLFGAFEFAARRITLFLMRRADLSIVLTDYSRNDAAVFEPRQIEVIPNGIPDPCPKFEKILAEREARLATRLSAAQPVLKVLFLAHCTREKGLFDTMAAVENANRSAGKLRVYLSVAGNFMEPTEESTFQTQAAATNKGVGFEAIKYTGFLEGPEKAAELSQQDILCFPTTYPGEALPVNMIEAMAHGLPVVITNWRGISTIPPEGWSFLCSPHHITDLTNAIRECSNYDGFRQLRERFLERFEIRSHLKMMLRAIRESVTL